MAEILVAYATKMGATKEIAEAVAKRIRSAAHQVTVLDVADVESVEQYKAVVLGSALYAARWRPEAVRFLKRNAAALARKPVWLFHSGPLGDDLSSQKAPRKVRELATRIGAEQPATFGGRLTPDTAVGFFAKKMAQGPMSGDFRDWNAIELWANHVAEQFVAAR